MLSDNEFEVFLYEDKVIEGDITWSDDEDHSPAVEFQVDVWSPAGFPLVLHAKFNRFSAKLSFAIIHRGTGRIYALDLGVDHRNPNGALVGETHKHRWTERFRDRQAYCPADITQPATEPVAVWREFCAEANIDHQGTLHEPPEQGELEL